MMLLFTNYNYATVCQALGSVGLLTSTFGADEWEDSLADPDGREGYEAEADAALIILNFRDTI